MKAALLFSLLLAAMPLRAQDFEIDASPKDGLDESVLTNMNEDSGSVISRILLYIPNRILDAIDIVRVDLGIGGAAGGVVRMTSWGQMGYRYIDPGTLRVGLFGRTLPIMIEEQSEYGFGPDFHVSFPREVCDGEIGIGVDAAAGAYVGICLDEAADFLAGLFLVDLKHDDID